MVAYATREKMVTININIGKKHLFVFCVVIGIVAGMLVAYAYNVPPLDWDWTDDTKPANFGHSVDEIAWDAAPIMKNIGLGEGSDGRRLWVQGGDGGKRTAAFVNDNRLGVAIGAKISDEGGVIQAFKGSIVQELHLNPDGGNVGIGTSALPTEKLQVVGNVKANGITLGQSASKTLTYVSGINPSCPVGMRSIMKRWGARTCNQIELCEETLIPPSCTTSEGGWSPVNPSEPIPPNCNYEDWTGSMCTGFSCVANFAELLCIE